MTKKKIIIATIKTWNYNNSKFFITRNQEKYDVLLITSKSELAYQEISKFNPDYIFFPHWSWIIPESIYTSFKCVVFHSTDLPYGKGGSPIQNLISQKKYDSMISAIKVDKEIDSGDVYLKEPISLYGSTVEEIFIRISNVIFEKMIPEIIDNNLKPCPQKGNSVKFKRRKPEESKIDDMTKYSDFYDKIRMLDAEGYPKAFIELDDVVIEFSRAAMYSDYTLSDAKIYKKRSRK